MEMLLTDAFLMLSAHMAGGKTDAVTIDPQWRAAGKREKFNWDSFIDSALQSNQIIENLQMLAPRHREYINLRSALEKYQQIRDEGGWESYTTSLPKLEKGMRHPDVTNLRNRLAITQGNIDFVIEDQDLFDQPLHDNVVLFQRRNGLSADGVVGKGTIEAMNFPVEERIVSIEVNLERWRWLSEDLGKQYIKVNIANYELQAIENDKIVFQSEAIVGRPYRRTPVFSSLMTYIVFNPNWTVPPTILFNDVIPAMRINPGYLAEKRMKVLRADGSEVNPGSIDWNNVTAGNFPYRIRQEPGRDNALGSVKFMFPNQYMVYIHDTPSRNLFSQTDRSFSSGCIRINKPLEFAEYLLTDNPVWTPEQIKNIIDLGRERTVNLPSPVPVHLLYLTSWADNDGIVYFRKDIYDRDQPLKTALAQSPIAPGQ
jgi:L,D-transpeptidase YcbB